VNNPVPEGRGNTRRRLLKMALIAGAAALLCLFLAEGVWILRGQFVLNNFDREMVRFLARGRTREEDWRQPILDWLESYSNQGPLDFTSAKPNATIIVTRFEILAGYPCDPDQPGNPPCNSFCANPPCDCSAPDRRQPGYAEDDRITLPPPLKADYAAGVTISDTFRLVYGLKAPRHTTRLQDTLWEKLREEVDMWNCRLLAEDPGLPPGGNGVLVIEVFYEQPQLLGLPPLSSRLTDPVALYAQTTMRLVRSREE